MRIRLLCALLFACSSAQSGLINGSFEAGFTGWSYVGGFAPVGTVGPYQPTDGALQGGLESILGGPDDAEIAALLGLPPSQLSSGSIFEEFRQDFGPGETALDQCEFGDDCFTEDSAAVYQQFDVVAGQAVQFDFNWLSGDRNGFDAAFATLAMEGGYLILLLGDGEGNGPGTLDPSAPPVQILCGDVLLSPLCQNYLDLRDGLEIYGFRDQGATGYLTATLPIQQSGPATLGFVVLSESTSFSEPSGLLVDNVQIVPVPGAAWLLGSALGLLGWLRKKAG